MASLGICFGLRLELKNSWSKLAILGIFPLYIPVYLIVINEILFHLTKTCWFRSGALQRAIVQCPRWKSRILNVVAKQDHVASFLSSDNSYKPLGTFLFCTELGRHAAFEDQDSIMRVLKAMKTSNEGNLKIYDYTNVLRLIRRKALYHGVSELSEFNLNSLRAGITMQLREIAVLDYIPNDQIEEMENKQIEIIERKNNAYEPTKELNEMKIKLTYMEWYMKARKKKGGYYDVYKNDDTRDEIMSRKAILTIKGHLNQYWEKTVEDKDKMPQKQGAKLRKRWLYDGTNYRRIVEPMDIAEHYRKGNKNYIKYRSGYYKLLEAWFDEDKKVLESSKVKRNTAASLTEDSCFWAHVEEALISSRDLVNGGSTDIEQKLEEFEAYMMKAADNYSLSLDIFVEGSSFMRWGKEYKAHKGTTYTSKFYQYMNNGSYKSYQ
ncbi:senescence-associated carboxylesterase 101-like [Bidens hawaiensis]|uniref:senescence-associated carboxylesterase 101-like n=1 Tax=Bidens hawaiensis TaxID=980011 RepID=UPI00404A8A7B